MTAEYTYFSLAFFSHIDDARPKIAPLDQMDILS